MIAAWMLYASAVTACFCFAAVALEKSVRLAGRPGAVRAPAWTRRGRAGPRGASGPVLAGCARSARCAHRARSSGPATA